MKTRTITFGFSKSKLKFAPFSWAIRLWESLYWSIKLKEIVKVEQSHMYIKFDTRKIFDDYTVYHAASGMVHYLPYETFKEKNESVKEIVVEVPYELYSEIRKKLHKRLSRKYGTAQNAGIIVTDLASLIGKEMDNPWKNGYNCSEAGAEAMIALKPELAKQINLNRIKPQEARMLSEEYFEEQ